MLKHLSSVFVIAIFDCQTQPSDMTKREVPGTLYMVCQQVAGLTGSCSVTII